MFLTAFIRRTISIQRSVPIKHSFYSTGTSSRDAFILEQQAEKEHAGKTANLWRKISILYVLADLSLFIVFSICIPALLLSGANALQLYLKHHDHLSHVLEERENDPTPEYPYLDQNIRNKKFFWGKQDICMFSVILT
ncbi:uncharacterized protein T551_01375 [Pneumocystis jirovecii RU7]|uniref:Uncharacterized protein n=1 Tax=Pneumocystis jirovecii (strain RU7) TaxID=1408657 RepID=A0A0W4ZSE3_PNEJ7|nr:uncharacterized protein T551_01375 [Pneumocystis jirovecii RU7]KTW31303.1 hypothetical protein T551_01375 [Pneumocystis jirovecii RU7]